MRLVVIAGLMMGVSLAQQASFGAQARGAYVGAGDTAPARARRVWFFNANSVGSNATVGGFKTEQDCRLGADLLRQYRRVAICSACFAREGLVTIDMPVD
jgi:hypothetical protein